MTRRGVLAIDHGAKRTGFAYVDPLRIAPLPLEPFEGAGGGPELVAHVAQLCGERDVGVLLIGLPLDLDGGTSARATDVRAFSERLRAAQPRAEIVLYDERLTTKAAEELLREAEIPQRDRKRLRDSFAALVLLRDWLESGEPR